MVWRDLTCSKVRLHPINSKPGWSFKLFVKVKTSLNVISIFRQLGSTGNRLTVALQTGNSGISRRTMTGLISGICWKSGTKTENTRKYLWWSLFLTILFLEERRKIRRLLALVLKTMSGIYIFTWLCKHYTLLDPNFAKFVWKRFPTMNTFVSARTVQTTYVRTAAPTPNRTMIVSTSHRFYIGNSTKMRN